MLRVKPILWTGSGGDNNWQTAGNWNSTVTDKMLHFYGSTRLNNTNNYTADTPFGGIQFVNGAGAFTLGGNRIKLNGDIINQSSNDQTINLAMNLAGADRSIDAVTRNLTITGAIGQDGGTYGIAKRGAGTLVLSGNNTYAGKTVIGAGVLSVASLNKVASGTSSSNLGAPATVANGTIDIGAAGTAGQLTYTGAGETTDRVINLAGTTGNNTGTLLGSNSYVVATLDQSGTGLLKFTSALTATGSGAKTLTLQGSTAGTGEIAGAIVDGSGTTSLTKAGTGTWVLSGANTYTGTTYVHGGTLKVDAGAGGSLYGTAPYSALTFGGPGTFNYDNTTAAVAKAQNMGALTFSVGDGTVQVTRTAAQTVGLTFSSLATRTAGATGNFVYAGTPGTIGTDSSITLTGAAAGFMDQGTFFGGSNYAWMNAAGTYVRGVDYVTPDTGAEDITASTASFTPGKLYERVSGSGAITAQATQTITTLNIANANDFVIGSGNTLTVNGILKSGNAAGGTISGGTGIKAASGIELVIRTDQASDTLTISTPILANGTNALTKSGGGTLTLSGSAANTYSGVTYANAGTLKLDKSSGTAIAGGGLTINSGALVQYAAAPPTPI